MDYTLNYMKENNIPLTRENYIEINWMGDYKADEPLPAELEAELPKQFQLQPNAEQNSNDGFVSFSA